MDTKLEKILDFKDLPKVRPAHPGKKIVHCHGVFDVLHAGHLEYFKSAKKFGEILVVTITADQFVNKGPGRPYFTGKIRAAMLAAMEIVDHVAVNNNPLATTAIEELKPDFYVKGPDYKDKSKDPTGGIYKEETTTEKHGGKLVFTDDEMYSSSSLINKFFSTWTDDQQKTINLVKQLGGLDLIESVLEKASKESIDIVGEPIVDTYVFCVPEAISSKSPSISAQFMYEENYSGGSLAIANHLADFSSNVKLFIAHGGESYFKTILKEKMDKRIQILEEVVPSIPTPRKTRYIAHANSQRMFELTQIRSDLWSNVSPQDFISKLAKNSNGNFTIIADFGHGLFEGAFIESLAELKGFTGLNVQTNSSNQPFNPYTKHKHFSYLSIDTKEAKIAFHDRLSSSYDLSQKVRRNTHSLNAAFSMTLGPNGAYYYSKGSDKEIWVPAFTDTVIDATGAGDAYFAITALLTKSGAPDLLVPFLGNIFAGLKTKIIGNKASVTRAQLIKAVTSILK